MTWIELHQSLRDHRKTIDLADRLDMPEPHVVGHLMYLWLWALDNAEDDGTLTCSDRVIEKASGWVGDAGVFVEALIAVKFLDVSDDGVAIHDWEDYTGRLLERREKNAERQKRFRENHKTESNALRNAHVTATLPLRNDATVPNRTVPNRTEPRSIAHAHETSTAPLDDEPTTSDERNNLDTWMDEPLIPVAEAVLAWLNDDPPRANVARQSLNEACTKLIKLGATPEQVPKRGARLLARPDLSRAKVHNWRALAKYWPELEETHAATHNGSHHGSAAENRKPRRYVAALHKQATG
jgi:hypothetical protein